jgi:hypothetical protein
MNTTDHGSNSTQSDAAAYRRGASIRGVLGAAFVAWHLTVLLVRNTAGLFDAAIAEKSPPAYQKLNRAMRWYETKFGLYQAWPMFTSPISRWGPFLTTELHFDDGTSIEIKSDNEPADLTSFFRVGLARQRKHEDYLSNNQPQAWHYERAIWEQFVRWKMDRWRSENPNDRRQIVATALWVDRVYFPQPYEPPDYLTGERFEIARFGPDGAMR